MRTLEEVLNYFTYHAPDEDARSLHERVGNIFQQVAEILWETVPPFNQGSPDKTVMFRTLSDARISSNMAIACYKEPISQASDASSEGTSQSPIPGPDAAPQASQQAAG